MPGRLLNQSLVKIVLLLTVFVVGCTPVEYSAQILPTERPTATETTTPAPTRTPGFNATPTVTPPLPPQTATGGPSPTPLFGATSTPDPDQPDDAVVASNPNAPRIEFFTSDVVAASPGSSVTLYWSTRGFNAATIFRLDRNGARVQQWNVPPDGNLVVDTRAEDRVEANFLLSVGDDNVGITEQNLAIQLACPNVWFFQPSPQECPASDPLETRLIEERFERGRMLYVEGTNSVYALFNDDIEPAWLVFENRYDPNLHPELEEAFVPPPGFVQPLRILGFVWRGSDVVRSRLGLGLEPEFVYEGFAQTVVNDEGQETLYVSSADGTILQLLPEGALWQIIVPPPQP